MESDFSSGLPIAYSVCLFGGIYSYFENSSKHKVTKEGIPPFHTMPIIQKYAICVPAFIPFTFAIKMYHETFNNGINAYILSNVIAYIIQSNSLGNNKIRTKLALQTNEFYTRELINKMYENEEKNENDKEVKKKFIGKKKPKENKQKLTQVKQTTRKKHEQPQKKTSKLKKKLK